MTAPTSLVRRTAAGLALVPLVATGCSTKDTNDTAGGTAGDDASTGTANGPVELKDGSTVKLALIPGGAHPYFQPWKTTAEQDKTEFKLGGVTFNETGEWDQGSRSARWPPADLLASKGKEIKGIVTTARNPAVAAADGVVTKTNVDSYDTERKAKTVELQKDFVSQLSCS